MRTLRKSRHTGVSDDKQSPRLQSFRAARAAVRRQAKQTPHLTFVQNLYTQAHHGRVQRLVRARAAAHASASTPSRLIHQQWRSASGVRSKTRKRSRESLPSAQTLPLRAPPIDPHRRFPNVPVLRVATDCSGIEAPIAALELLRIPHVHQWSADIDSTVQQSVDANYKPVVSYTDLFKRDHTQLPDIDLYVCGFPCQSFSSVNRIGAKGFHQENRKGLVFFECMATLAHTQPSVFVLENVRSLLSHDSGQTFAVISKHLDTLRETYHIGHRVLNAKDYDGGLQNRPRLYIVGVRKDVVPSHQKSVDFDRENGRALFPQTRAKHAVSVDDVLLPDEQVPLAYQRPVLTPHKQGLLRQLEESGRMKNNTNYIVNLNISGRQNFQVHPMQGTSPCLLAAVQFYMTQKKRHICPREALRIQGFPDTFKQVVSDRQMTKQVGNSMSVAVLAHIFAHLIGVLVPP